MVKAVWLSLIAMLLLVSSVFAVAPSIQEIVLPAAAYGSSASNSNVYGLKAIVLQNCTLYAVQKEADHNGGDSGLVQVYHVNNSEWLTPGTAWVGDNATFATPIVLTKGMYLQIFENQTGTRTLSYEPNGLASPSTQTYLKYTTACYYGSPSSLCTDDVGNANGAVWALYLEPPAVSTGPQWSNNVTNATDDTNLGDVIGIWTYWSDDTGLDGYITQYNTSGSYVNDTYIGFGAGDGNYSFTTESSILGIKIPKNRPGNSTYGFKWFANDTSGNWNTTPVWHISVYDRYPNYLVTSDNVSEPWYGGAVRFYADWFDDGWLNNSGVTGYFLLYNSTTLITNSTPAAYGTSNFNTGGWSANYYKHDFNLAVAGTYGWITCVNDSDSKWACSEMKNITIVGSNPGWYDYGSNSTGGQIYEGGDVVLFSNWTVSSGSLTNFSLRERYDNGTWYLDNATGWTAFSCGDYSDCAAEVTSVGSMEPIGNHTFVFVANSSQDGFNQTPGFDIEVLRSMWLYEDDPTYLGSDLYRETTEGNMSVAPVETASRGITTLTMPPVMRDINGDGRDEIFFLDGNNLEIYNNTGLDIVSTTTFVGENFHRFIIVPNWTANFSVLALTEDEGNVILNDLRITNSGTSFTLNTTNITDWFTNYKGGEMLMGCGNQSCVVAYTQYNYSFEALNTTQASFALAFSKQLDSVTSPLLLQNNTVNGGICFSRWKNMEVKDINGSGEKAIFTSMAINHNGNDEGVAVWYLDATGGSLSKYHRENISMGNAVRYGLGPGTIKCYDDGSDHSYTGANRFVSNTLVFNSGVTESTLETHLALTTNDFNEDGDFRIVIVGTDWASVEVSPSGDQGIMSNLVQAANHSFCAWGFESPDRFVCGINSSDLSSENWEVVGDDYAYTYDWADTLYATSFIPSQPDFIIRNGLWYYGGSDELVRDVEWNYTFAVPVPVVSESGVDLVITTATTMYYFDDGYLELPASLTWWKVNPCIYNEDGYETWWENTTTVYVWANVTDGDAFLKDNVSIRYILYNGTDHEQVSEWEDGTSHTVQFQINTSANYTTNTSLGLNYTSFVMQVNDTGNKTAVNTSFKYRVNTSLVVATVEYGDCSSEMGDLPYNASLADEDIINNSFIQGVKDVGAMAGFTGGLIKVFWLLIMAFIAGVLWWQVGAENPQLASGLIIGIELLMLFIGYYFELIPGVILFIVAIAGGIVGIMFFKKRVMDS